MMQNGAELESTERTGGFDVEFVNTLEDRYRCYICGKALREPVQTPCGDRFCESCLRPILSGPNPKCPIDGEDLIPNEIFRDVCCEREILQLACYCKNRDDGCTWTGRLASLEEHGSQCAYRKMACPNPGCTTQVLYNQLTHHLENICAYKKVPCQFCGQLIVQHEQETHKETCSKLPVPCPEGCSSADVPRDMIDDHLANHCPLAEILCPFENVGCPFKGSRDRVNEHCLETVKEHSELVARGLGDLNLQRTQTNQKVEALTAEKARLETQFNNQRETLAAAVQDLRVQQTRVGNAERVINEHKRDFSQFRQRLDTLQGREVGEQFAAQLEEFRIVIREHDIKLGNLERQMARTPSYPVSRTSGTGASSMSLERRLDRNEHQLALHDVNLAEHDLKIQMLEATSYDGKYVWKIDDWSRRFSESASGKTPSIYSPPFYVGRFGYKVCARVYPHGDGAGKGSHVSLFFVVMRGEYDALLPWPFHHKVSFKLLDQERQQHVTDTFRPDPNSSSFNRPTSNMNIASGCPTFISHPDLRTRGYTRGNTLFIKIVVDMSGIPVF